MRTTIELPDAQRARLLEIAATRGLKGFSLIVQEAIALYLQQVEDRQEARDAALALRGSLGPESAEKIRQSVANLRETWR